MALSKPVINPVLSEEETNFLRLANLVIRVAPRAVRCLFDKYFNPGGLQLTLNLEKIKIEGLNKKRIINQAQMDILYPKTGTVKSSDMDLTLMICLLRNLKKLKIQDSLPNPTDCSEEADLSHIKYYRNWIAHSHEGKIGSSDFKVIWETLSEAIQRLGGPTLTDKCNMLLVTELDNSYRDVYLNFIKTEGRLAKVEDEIKVLSDKFDLLQNELNDPVPKSVREQMKKQIDTWKVNEKKYVSTGASDHVLECVRENSCVTVTASSGAGKTATMRHTALILQQEGYSIIPITVPTDIRDYYQPGKPTVFTIDDMCGNFTAKQHIIESWKQVLEVVRTIIAENVCKIIVACRLQVYKDKAFSILSLFKSCECNLISEELYLSSDEKKAIAKSHIGKNADKIYDISEKCDCFPLLCYLCSEEKDVNVTDFFKNPFEIYKKELDNLYYHGDEAHYFGEKMINCLIEHADGGFIRERFLWKTSVGDMSTNKEFIIILPDDILESYIGRLVSDWTSGRVIDVFSNSNFKNLKFREEFLHYVSQLDKQQQKDLIGTTDNVTTYKYVFGATSFCCVCYLEYIDLMQWMLDNNADVNQSDKYGVSPLWLACYCGHLLVVCKLLELNVDINMCNKNGRSPLWTACNNNHFELVCKLSEFNADTNKCDNNGQSPLWIACSNGHLGDVCHLLELNVDVHKCDNNGRSPLWTACDNGHLGVVCSLLELNVDINKCDNSGCSPLWTACCNSHLEVVFELLELDVDINQCGNNDRSPLWMACYIGHCELVCKLLKLNADINLCDNYGQSPLWTACNSGHLGVVCQLLKLNADINMCDTYGQSPLWTACDNGHLGVVCQLIRMNVDINKCDSDGRSPLWSACENGHLGVVCKLLELKVDVNRCDNDRCSPILTACCNAHLGVVCKLLEFDVDINQCDNDGRSPLWVVCYFGFCELVSNLLECNVDINKLDNYGQSPLWTACNNGHLEVVCQLLELNVDINKCDYNGRSPLWTACDNGHLGVVCQLLRMNVDIYQCDKDGCSPLWVACHSGHLGVVCKLLELNVDINKCDNDGCSPLLTACSNGHLGVVGKLLELNIDINKCDNNGRSPLWMSCYIGHCELVCKLLEFNPDLNQCDNNGRSPLWTANANDHLDVVCKLLEFD